MKKPNWWTVTSGRANTNSGQQSKEPTTGFDFMSQWKEEIRIITEHGPFTPDELKGFSVQQTADYFYVTSWILRQDGKDAFVAGQRELRELLLRRLESGERLNPLATGD